MYSCFTLRSSFSTPIVTIVVGYDDDDDDNDENICSSYKLERGIKTYVEI